MHCWSTYSRWTTFCKNKIKATSVSWSADDVLKHRPSSDDHLLFLSQYIKFWPSIKKRSLHSSFKTVPDVTGVPGSSAVVAPRILHFPDSGWVGKMQRLVKFFFYHKKSFLHPLTLPPRRFCYNFCCRLCRWEWRNWRVIVVTIKRILTIQTPKFESIRSILKL